MALALQPSLLSGSRCNAASAVLYRQQPHQLLRPNHIISSPYHASHRLPIARCQPKADKNNKDENTPMYNDASQPSPVSSAEVEASSITVAPQPEEWSEWDKVTKTQDWNDVSTEPRRNSIGIGFLTAIILGLSVVTWQLHRVISHANAEGRLPWQRDSTATAAAARPSVQENTTTGARSETKSASQDKEVNTGPSVIRKVNSQRLNARRAERIAKENNDSNESNTLPASNVAAQTAATVTEINKDNQGPDEKMVESVTASKSIPTSQDVVSTKINGENVDQRPLVGTFSATQQKAETQKQETSDKKVAVAAKEQTDSDASLKSLLEELTNGRSLANSGKAQQEQNSANTAHTQQPVAGVQKLTDVTGQQPQSQKQQQSAANTAPSTAVPAATPSRSFSTPEVGRVNESFPASNQLNGQLPAAMLGSPAARSSTQIRLSPAPVPPISRAVDASALDSLSNDQSVSALRERLVVSLKAASAAGEASQRAAAYAAAASSAASRAAEAAEKATTAASEAQGSLDSATDSIVTQYEERIAKAVAAAKEAEARAAAAAAVATSYEDVARTQANISERAAAIKKPGPDSSKHSPLEQLQHFLRQAVDGVLGSHGSS